MENASRNAKTLYNVTKSEGEETLAKRKEQARHHQALRNFNITVGELFGEFFQIKRRTLSASALERYEGMFRNYIGPAIGKAKVSALRPEHLTRRLRKVVYKRGQWEAAIWPHRPPPARPHPVRPELRRPERASSTERRGVFGNRGHTKGNDARADSLGRGGDGHASQGGTQSVRARQAIRRPQRRALVLSGRRVCAVYGSAARRSPWSPLARRGIRIQHRHHPAVTHENP